MITVKILVTRLFLYIESLIWRTQDHTIILIKFFNTDYASDI